VRDRGGEGERGKNGKRKKTTQPLGSMTRPGKRGKGREGALCLRTSALYHLLTNGGEKKKKRKKKGTDT